MAKVLIVDETKACGEELTKPLQSCGLEVVSLTSHREATRRIEKDAESFDFLVLCIARSPRETLTWLQETRGVRLKVGLLPGRVLCLASSLLDPDLELDFEECGARVIYER